MKVAITVAPVVQRLLANTYIAKNNVASHEAIPYSSARYMVQACYVAEIVMEQCMFTDISAVVVL